MDKKCDDSNILAEVKDYLESEKDSDESYLLFADKPGPVDGEHSSDEGVSMGKASGIKKFNDEIKSCKKCGLGTTRTNFVFGEGSPASQLVFVGEAPGRDEDLQGRPFVGRAGQLLTKIIEAMEYKRSDVFICNVLKCRPPNNRAPAPEEIEQCEPYLIEQLKILKPKVICALGSHAAKTLLKMDTPISAMRGKFYDYHGIKLMATFHPAYLLRNPSAKREVWEDVKKIKNYLET